MKLLDQLKTTQGKIPVSNAEVYQGEDGVSRIHFSTDFQPDNNGLLNSNSKEPVLEDLAFLWDNQGRIRRERIVDLAKHTGPLFGPSEYERLSDWISESAMAKDVIAIQEVLNGDRPARLLDGMGSESSSSEDLGESAESEELENLDVLGEPALVAKSVVHSRLSSNNFYLYSYTLPLDEGVSQDFFSNMPQFPHFKRFASSDSYDYVFITLDDASEEPCLLVTLFAFRRDITPVDFILALDACSVENKEDIEALMLQAEAEASLSIQDLQKEHDFLLGSTDLQVQESSIEKADYPHIQHLVQAVVSLRLMGIGVDVFRSSENDDFLLFPMYATYLWYSFSKKLGQVKIGYCELCGRGFSLTGHRGMPRRFCSEECKTKAKNERSKYQREEIRRLFLEEEFSVEEIARIVFSEELKGAKPSRVLLSKVRKTLGTYPALKQRITKELKEGKDISFTRRCVSEGILPKKELEEQISLWRK